MMEPHYWVMDTETTGMPHSDGHRLIEVGAIELVGRSVTGRYVHFYLDPGRDIDPGATRVHGITIDMLKGMPSFADVATDLLGIFKDTTLIAHNASFDMGFLDNEFTLAGFAGGLSPHCNVIDTLSYARKHYPGGRHSLDALCKRFNIDNSSRELHGALLDCEILIEVYLAMTGGQTQLLDGSEVNAPTTITKPAETTPLHASGAKARNLILQRATEQDLSLHKEVCLALKIPEF